MKIALCQTTVHKDWHKNLRNAERVIADAVKTKADMVVLPEMFICPYNKKAISAAAQPEGSLGSQAEDQREGIVARRLGKQRTAGQFARGIPVAEGLGRLPPRHGRDSRAGAFAQLVVQQPFGFCEQPVALFVPPYMEAAQGQIVARWSIPVRTTYEAVVGQRPRSAADVGDSGRKESSGVRSRSRRGAAHQSHPCAANRRWQPRPQRRP